tara:strand:- start:3256 stop:3903 length:648 start_codon:yes stop_codon:yes gene_type:complete
MGTGKRKLFTFFLAAGLLFVFGTVGLGGARSLAAASATGGPGGQAQASKPPPLNGVLQDNFLLFDPPPRAPTTPFGLFVDGQQSTITLADFQGKVLLVNFWATWCAPCVREMPSLNRLQAKFKDRGLEVLTVSNDRLGIAQVTPFYAELALDSLGYYLDPRAELAQALGVRGLPTTYLIDARGRVIGGLLGAMEWDSPEVETLLNYYLQKRPEAA